MRGPSFSPACDSSCRKRRIDFVAGIVLACIFGSPLSAEEAESPPVLNVTNYFDGESVRYSVPLLRGEVVGSNTVTVTNLTRTPSTVSRGIVSQGRFKVLCELKRGANRLHITAGKAEVVLCLNFVPPTNDHFVRAVYMTDKSGAVDYQAPNPDDPQDYESRIGTALKLMQTMTAERMHDLGFGRRTFNLELDDAGRVRVHLFRGAQSAEEYYKLPDQLWYREVASEVERRHATASAKNIVIAAYTRFDPKTGKTRGHTALGGGGQALFGSANLFTWPENVDQAQAVFMDAGKIDPKTITSDSAFRDTIWSAASTTIGATLHELGHTFGLPHSTERFDIMTRGFDHFNRVFTFEDPISAVNKKPLRFEDSEIAAFSPISAAALVTSPWLSADASSDVGKNEIAVVYSKEHDQVIAASRWGIRYIGGRAEGSMKHFAAPPPLQPAPIEFSTDLAPFQDKLGDEGELMILDGVGHRREIRIEDLPLAGE